MFHHIASLLSHFGSNSDKIKGSQTKVHDHLSNPINESNSLLLPAVGGPRVEASVALAADHLVRVVLLREEAQGRLDDAAAQTEHQVQGGL